jgi:hypothetical protein
MRIGSLFDLNSMADDFAWLGAAVYDQIAQIFVVFLDGRLPAAHDAPWSKNSASEKGKMPFLSCPLFAPGSGAL